MKGWWMRAGTVLFVNVMASGATVEAQPRSSATGLSAVTAIDAERMKVLGTGCSWRDGTTGSTMLIAADDVAIVRTSGGVARLRPHRKARDLFPFTFDRWTHGGLELAIVRTGRSKRIGSEAVDTPADLAVTIGGTTSRMRGVLNCGS